MTVGQWGLPAWALPTFPLPTLYPFIILLFFLFIYSFIEKLLMIYRIGCGKCGYFNSLKFAHVVIHVHRLLAHIFIHRRFRCRKHIYIRVLERLCFVFQQGVENSNGHKKLVLNFPIFVESGTEKRCISLFIRG